MSESLTVEVQGLEEAIRRFGDTGLVRSVLKDAMHKAVYFLHERLAKYPPPPAGFHVEFVSERQRRYFFWALRTGEIVVPYRRTGTLGRLWTTKVEGQGADLVGTVGNAVPYARYVMGEGMQAAVHQGRWPTAESVARESTPQIVGYFSEAMEEIARRLAEK